MAFVKSVKKYLEKRANRPNRYHQSSEASTPTSAFVSSSTFNTPGGNIDRANIQNEAIIAEELRQYNTNSNNSNNNDDESSHPSTIHDTSNYNTTTCNNNINSNISSNSTTALSVSTSISSHRTRRHRKRSSLLYPSSSSSSRAHSSLDHRNSSLLDGNQRTMDSHFVGRTSTACPRFCPDASPVIQPNSSSAQKDNDNQKSARWMKRILGKAAQLKQYSQNSVSKGTLFATKTGKSLKKHFLKGIHRDRQHDGDNEAYISDDDIYLRQNNLAAKSVAAFPLITTSMDSKDIRNESDSDPESDGDNSYDKEALDLRYFYDPQSEDSVNRITFLTGPEHYYHLALQLETSPCQEFQLYGKELYIRAAGLGYAPAQFKLGICYELGLTHFPMDPTQSFAWYKRAALQGHADAELAVSGWYLTGHPQGLIQSEPLAYEWASKAAKRGWAKAEYTLGHYYEVGIGVPQDLAVAKQWYIKAAAQGNERALLRLLVGHVGLDVDYAHLKDALLHQNQNNPYLIHQLAQFHEHREYGLVPDEDAAFELYAASAQANYAPAQYKLGACYEFGILGCPQDPVQAVHWYRRGAENGHVEALLALAGFYLDGSAGQAAEQSDEEAFRFVEAAAQRGVPKAEYITGFFLEHGLGVEQNINEAKRWYHLACAKGVDSAEKRLKDLEKLSDFS